MTAEERKAFVCQPGEAKSMSVLSRLKTTILNKKETERMNTKAPYCVREKNGI